MKREEIPQGVEIKGKITPEYETVGSAMNLQAVIEPDADGDGYGDQTQDLCPIDPTVHAACTKPTISSFRFFHSKFYVNKSASPIIASTSPKGSTMSLNLSLASTVRFTVNKRVSGRTVSGKCVRPTNKNHSKKSCTYDVKQWSFAKTLPAGVSSIAFPGTAKVNGHTKSLTVGDYDASAVAVSTFTSTTGDAKSAKFSIVAAPKPSHH